MLTACCNIRLADFSSDPWQAVKFSGRTALIAMLVQVGVTAMLLAAKYEEIWPPEVRDFVYISDQAYTREQILDMEKLMLNTLRFNMTVPTPLKFLARYFKAANLSQCSLGENTSRQYATYLTELAMLDYSMLQCPYSLVSAAAVYVAWQTLGRTTQISPCSPSPCRLPRGPGQGMCQQACGPAAQSQRYLPGGRLQEALPHPAWQCCKGCGSACNLQRR